MERMLFRVDTRSKLKIQVANVPALVLYLVHLLHAVQVAQQLEAKQQQQRLRQQQGQPRSERCLGQVYSLIHKLGCVARQAAAEGLLPDTAAPADTASAPAGGVEAAVAAAAALRRCQPLLAGLKQQAEKLLLQAAKQPQGAA